VVRVAFTMIELIFAIVIIGITVISLPMMTQATSKGIEDNLVQEAIFAASAELNLAVTAHWDENSIEPGSTDTLARVINTGLCNNITKLRPGHISQPLHRRCLDSSATPIASSNTGAVDALEDAAHGSKNIFTTTITDQAGYKKKYNSVVTVTPSAIFDGANNQNMKKITVTIFDTEIPPNIVTVLNTYSANIGEVDYYKRSY